MNAIIINASPRKNWNTAQLLKEAQKGAKSVGAETEYIDLYDMTFTGCRSCMACKLKTGKHPGCAWKDKLSPLIDRILVADTLIKGMFERGLHGNVRSYAACDTLQVKDYFRYDMEIFSEEAKKAHHNEQFPKDIEAAYMLGVEMARA